MNDLRKASFFAPLDGVIDEAVTVLESESLLLVTTADLSSIIALGFLESALLTEGFHTLEEFSHQTLTYLRMNLI